MGYLIKQRVFQKKLDFLQNVINGPPMINSDYNDSSKTESSQNESSEKQSTQIDASQNGTSQNE